MALLLVHKVDIVRSNYGFGPDADYFRFHRRVRRPKKRLRNKYVKKCRLWQEGQYGESWACYG